MSSATVTPSLVTLGAPHPLSSTALRPRGPSVLPTARDSLPTPANRLLRASSSKLISFATASPLVVLIRRKAETGTKARGGLNWQSLCQQKRLAAILYSQVT